MRTADRGSVTGTNSSKKKSDRSDFDFIDEFQEKLESQLRGVLARLDSIATKRDRCQDDTRTMAAEREMESGTSNTKGKGRKLKVTVKVRLVSVFLRWL